MNTDRHLRIITYIITIMQERQPFISIVTRTFGGRPNLYALHKASLAEQTFTWFEHVEIRNRKLDVLDANRSLHRERHRVRGRYVMILDDDDRLASPDTLELIYDAILQFNLPACLMVRMRRPDRIVPDDDHWRQPPQGGHIGSPCFIVRRDIWVKNIRKFGKPIRGDYHFVSSIWPEIHASTAWLDIVATEVMVVSHGRPEDVQP